MKLTDLSKLEKLMAMTTSANDPEALVAIRKANKLLADNKIGWSEFFKRTVTVEANEYEADAREEERSPGATRQSYRRDGNGTATTNEGPSAIERAFQKVLDTTKPGSFRDFILSLHAQWESQHWLSPAQRQRLFEAEDRANSRR